MGSHRVGHDRSDLATETFWVVMTRGKSATCNKQMEARDVATHVSMVQDSPIKKNYLACMYVSSVKTVKT